jgi:hypothetical protein
MNSLNIFTFPVISFFVQRSNSKSENKISKDRHFNVRSSVLFERFSPQVVIAK